MENSTPPALRLLIPIDSREGSRGCIRHVLNRAAAGDRVEVLLAYFLPPAIRADLLRFPSEQQEAEQHQRRACASLDEAAADLLAVGIPCRKCVREADPVQGIQDLAEEWACSEVILPDAWRLGPFGSSRRRKIQQLEQALPVTWVGEDGFSEPKGSHAP